MTLREPPGIRRHVLASANFFLGASNFIVLALPERYFVGQTINPSEVSGTELARGAAWVADGRCSHWLRDTNGGASLELLVVARRGERAPKWASARVSALSVAEHEGIVAVDSIRVGFPRRRELSRMRVYWPCERTKRSLELEIVAPPATRLDLVREALLHSECH